MAILKLLKYAAYLDLFEEIGKAISGAPDGKNFGVSSPISVKGKPRIIKITMQDA